MLPTCYSSKTYFVDVNFNTLLHLTAVFTNVQEVRSSLASLVIAQCGHH